MISVQPVSTLADIERISAMAYRIFPVDYGAYVRSEHIQYFLDEYQSIKAIQRQIDAGDLYFFVFCEKEVVGYMGISLKKDELELDKLYLDFNKRGLGIGGYIMSWLDSYAQKKKVKAINLCVLENNVRAINFYKMHGYERIDTFIRHFYTGYSEVNAIMQKRYPNGVIQN